MGDENFKLRNEDFKREEFPHTFGETKWIRGMFFLER